MLKAKGVSEHESQLIACDEIRPKVVKISKSFKD